MTNSNTANEDNCADCGKEAKYTAWRNEKGEKVCPKCVSSEDFAKAIKEVFPYGVPDNLD
jgi:recombinational DNA repair protein (RecF pathway)